MSPESFATLSKQLEMINDNMKNNFSELFERVRKIEVSQADQIARNDEKWKSHDDRSHEFMKRVEGVVEDSMQTMKNAYKNLPCKDHIEAIHKNTQFRTTQEKHIDRKTTLCDKIALSVISIIGLGTVAAWIKVKFFN